MIAKILLVDDHPLFRKGIASLLSLSPGLLLVGEAAHRREALELVIRVRPDLVLLDLTLGEESGLELLKDLRVFHPDLRVLVLSMHDEAVYAERALAAGAWGYVEKNEASEKVLEAIRTVLGGQRWFSDAVKERLLEFSSPVSRGSSQDAVGTLSDRELEVFTWIGRGLGVTRIAEQLHLSVKTIETYKEHLKQKLLCRDTQELKIKAAEWNARN